MATTTAIATCRRPLPAVRQVPSNIDGAAGAVDEVARIVARIRARGRRFVKAGRCEESGVGFVFGLAPNERLKAVLAPEAWEAERRCEMGVTGQRRPGAGRGGSWARPSICPAVPIFVRGHLPAQTRIGAPFTRISIVRAARKTGSRSRSTCSLSATIGQPAPPLVSSKTSCAGSRSATPGLPTPPASA